MGYAQCTAQEQVDEKCMCSKCLYKRAYARYSKTMQNSEGRVIALLAGIPEQDRSDNNAVAEFGMIWFMDHLDELGIPKDLPKGMIFVLSVAFTEVLIAAAKKLRKGKDTPG